MDILEYAMKMELDGKAYYDKQARNTKNKELKRIFELLSEEEERHYKLFKNMKDGNLSEAKEQLVQSSKTLTKVKNIFVEMSENKSADFGEDELSAWTYALGIEEKAESFYREKAEVEKDEEKKKLLSQIADEEKNHVHMIDSVMMYIKFPEAFADSAQFKDFQSLEGH